MSSDKSCSSVNVRHIPISISRMDNLDETLRAPYQGMFEASLIPIYIRLPHLFRVDI